MLARKPMDWSAMTSMVDKNSGKTLPVIIKGRHLLNNATFERTNLLQILSVITKRLPTTSLTQVQFLDVPSQNKKNTDILNNSMTPATGTGSKMMMIMTKIYPSEWFVGVSCELSKLPGDQWLQRCWPTEFGLLFWWDQRVWGFAQKQVL